MLPRTAQGLEMGAARIKSRVNKRGPFIGPHKPFSVVVLQELERHRVNIAFKTLSLYSVSGCDIEKRNHSEAIRRAVEHNKRDDASHHVPPGQIRRELSHLNQVLLGPAGVDAVVNLAESTFEEFDIVPPRVDSIVCIETVMFPGSLSVPEEFYAWTNDWIRQKFGPVIAAWLAMSCHRKGIDSRSVTASSLPRLRQDSVPSFAKGTIEKVPKGVPQ